jgi:hypothetical protein
VPERVRLGEYHPSLQRADFPSGHEGGDGEMATQVATEALVMNVSAPSHRREPPRLPGPLLFRFHADTSPAATITVLLLPMTCTSWCTRGGAAVFMMGSFDDGGFARSLTANKGAQKSYWPVMIRRSDW